MKIWTAVNLEQDTSAALRAAAIPLSAAPNDYDLLLNWIGDARLVLLGEASHGTHEFYDERAQITKRLIADHGFRAVVAEADWPDAYRVNRYVRGHSDDADADEALANFQRFPTWMWRNHVMLEFVTWLREFNDHSHGKRLAAGFYGMDLYSLHTSIAAVLQYLDKTDPEAARRARQRYNCFEQFGPDPQTYGHQTAFGETESCEDAVVRQLVELRRQQSELLSHDGQLAEDEFFFAEQNALLVKNAEEYYRAMFRGRISSWNLRDRHMVESLQALVRHLDHQQPGTRVVVWAHNSHLGDARATVMGRRGEWNVGQLVRQRFPAQSIAVGFTTHHGTVTAASDWNAPTETKPVRPALSDSYEHLFHEVNTPQFMLNLRDPNAAVELLHAPRLERAIGVIYLPEMERVSHYFQATLPEQFDVIIHLDETRALEPLPPVTTVPRPDLPETYPFKV